MIPAQFQYEAPASLTDAIALLKANHDAKILSGGMSLIPLMKFRLAQPTMVVDINNIEGLDYIREDGGWLKVGALTRESALEDSEDVRNNYPLLYQTTQSVADPIVRNRATLAGNLAHADPAGDWPALVLAADAGIEVQGKNGKRRIKATDFFTGLFSTALQENEIIIAVRVPIPPEGTKATYQKFAQPASRFAIVGCAIVRFPDGKTNIAFTGISDNAFRASDAEAALAGVIFLSDHYASAEYRKHLAKVYLKKALKAVS